MKINSNILCWRTTEGHFWIRFFREGFSVKNIDIHQKLFSEREGLVAGIQVGKYYIKYLPKCDKFNLKNSEQTDERSVATKLNS